MSPGLIIYANPSPRPHKAKTATKAKRKRIAAPKGAKPMAKHRTAAQKRATARLVALNRSRKRHKNPSSRKAKSRRRYAVHHNPTRRRRVHRNPSGGFTKGILGDLASKDGLMLLGAAAVAPTVVETIAGYVVPVQYNSGWTGLLARAAIAGGAVYVLDHFLKQRKAAIGFAAGAGGSLIMQAYKTYQVAQVVPAPTPAPVQDQIAKNPALYDQLMNGGQYDSLNGYAATPMGSYAATPMGDPYESLN